jgi:hypothetical protein
MQFLDLSKIFLNIMLFNAACIVELCRDET